MGNFERVVREEIVRLARREARKLAEPLREEVKRLKKRVVEQKARLGALTRKLDGMQVRSRLRETAAQAAAGAVKGRLTPRLIRSLRGRLKLSQQQFARLLGVSAITVGNWEQGEEFPPPGTEGEGAFAARHGTARGETAGGGSGKTREIIDDQLN